LYLMNSPLVLRVTEMMAKQLLADKTITDVQCVERIYSKIYNRPPTAKEMRRAMAFVNGFTRDRQSSWQALCQALVSSNEFLYLK